jgi:uncharacterized protein (TIGR02246 family)
MSPEDAARRLYADLIEAWNAGDAAAMAAVLDDQGLVVGFDGSQLVGAAEVSGELGRIFADHPTARYVTKVRSVHALGTDAALLHAVAGMVPPGGGELMPDRNVVQTVVAHRVAGEWVVALFQNTPAQLHGRPEDQQALTAELAALT